MTGPLDRSNATGSSAPLESNKAAAVSGADDARRRPWRATEFWAAAAVATLLLWAAWPEGLEALRYPDSHDYLAWPEPMSLGKGVGARIFGYPLLLRAFGSGSGIVALQVVAWLAGFAGLGFALARVPGMLAVGLLALAPAVAWWNVAILTEALTLSLAAGLLGLGLHIARRDCGAGWLLTWAVACIVFGFLRPGNLLVLPFLLVPFFRQGKARLAIACAIAGAVFLVGFLQTQQSALWKINYHAAFLTRVLPDPEARDYFEVRGMPEAPLQGERDWFYTNAGRLYPIWIATRPASYAEAWQWLNKEGENAELRERYFARQESLATPITPIASAFFAVTAIPRSLWVGLVALAVAIDWRRHGRPRLLSLWAVTLALGTYGQTFVAYHGSGSGMMRHLLLASLLYRFTWLIAIHSIARSFGDPPAAPRAGPSGG